jgi:hypothetical protein
MEHDENDEGKAAPRPTGRQPQHPGQPARYTKEPGDRDPGALAREGKADTPDSKSATPRPIPDPD